MSPSVLTGFTGEGVFDLSLPFVEAPEYDGPDIDVPEPFEWLRIAVKERGGTVVYLKVYGKMFLADLRPDPRYDGLLKLVGFEDR